MRQICWSKRRGDETLHQSQKSIGVRETGLNYDGRKVTDKNSYLFINEESAGPSEMALK